MSTLNFPSNPTLNPAPPPTTPPASTTRQKNILAVGIIAVILLVFTGTALINRRSTPANTQTKTGTIRIFTDPANGKLSAATPVSLKADSGTHKIGFAQVELQFDPNLLHVTDEIQITGPLTNIIKVTSLTDINATGHITIILGLDPANKDQAPDNVFELAKFNLAPVSNSSEPAKLEIVANTSQIVDTNSQQVSAQTDSPVFDLKP
jgi:hypothetical protein